MTRHACRDSPNPSYINFSQGQSVEEGGPFLFSCGTKFASRRVPGDLDMMNDNKMEMLHEKLAHSRDAIDQARARSIECLNLARSRWRGIEAMRSAPKLVHDYWRPIGADEQ